MARYNSEFMFRPREKRFFGLVSVCLIMLAAAAVALTSWDGLLIDSSGKPVAGAVVRLHSPGGRDYQVSTTGDGKFAFSGIEPGSYELFVRTGDRETKSATPVVVRDTDVTFSLQLLVSGEVALESDAHGKETAAAQASGGEHLSSSEVSSLPLNARDFSKLLLLAAGTMTDANGAANFTQQFAVNGQRGVTTVFAMDGFDTTDPEMGGATFSNFNVDAIQEVQSNSGVLTADIGHGAASDTNVVTKSGTNDIHGSVFEFLRNASLDARNYFDPAPSISGHRIPPFSEMNSDLRTAVRSFCPAFTTEETALIILASIRDSVRCWGQRR